MSDIDLRASLSDFASWRQQFLRGDEKGEAQTFLDRLFRAFGHEGAIEAGAVYEDRVRRRIDYLGVSYVDLMWKPRVLFEMKKAGSDLSRHFRQAFDYWQQAVPDRPRYVVLCNFDEFWIYDFDTQLDAPMDVVALTDLPQRHEALSFLLPEALPPIFGNDLVQVTRDAAGEVAAVFRSMVDRGENRFDAQQFILQSVVAMFAEDIGLLPSHFYTRTVEESRSGREAYDLLGSLFREMNTPGVTSGGRFEGTPYFNGGLFSSVTPMQVSDSELAQLRSACATDWSAVRPEIFGTLFETSMDAGVRHAQGAHFTTQADIMRVVTPCIVRPWMERIEAARTINDFELILLDMANYVVLDPACGSGNFLYVAYREMRRLEAEAKRRLVERTRGGTRAQDALSYVNADHFLGIDINPFAVEIAKVTLMMAKKLASDELDGGQTDVLPLENLDATIRHADALLEPWPAAKVIVGNPPYLGRRKMADELGAAYVGSLDRRFPNPGVSDLVTYWFPLAQAALPPGGRAGFVATQAVRDGASRERSLDRVVADGGVIFEAVSALKWSGDAAVTVSIVNWAKDAGGAPTDKTLWLDGGELRLSVEQIPPSLRPSTDVRLARNLVKNQQPKVCFQGQTTGNVAGFRLSKDEYDAWKTLDSEAVRFVHPTISGIPMLAGTDAPTFVIDLPHDDALAVAREAPRALAHLRQTVLPSRQAAAEEEEANNAEARAANPNYKAKKHHANFLRVWWKHAYRREDMLAAIEALGERRYIALSIVSAEERKSIYNFVSADIRPDASLQVFAFDDDYSFGVLSSAIHRAWFDERCSKLEARPRYTPTTVWNTFPWPSNPDTRAVAEISELASHILNARAEYLDQGMSLRAIYDTLRQPGQSRLRDAHDKLDDAVFRAYGFSREDDLLAQLLALNLLYAGDPDNAQSPGGRQFGRAAYASRYRMEIN